MTESNTGSDIENSTVITNSNFLEKLEECNNYCKNYQWDQFTVLWKSIIKFQESPDFTEGRENDELAEKFQVARSNAQQVLIEQFSKVDNFETFNKYISTLSIILSDSKALWNVIHTKISPPLKVTLRQSHEIAALYFKPHELFELGFESFSKSSMCDFANITNEEAIIDIFYATAGFVWACNLDPSYETNLPIYEDFIKKILSAFTHLVDFDAHRFVWLVEVISKHLHLSKQKFKTICTDVIQEYIHSHDILETANRSKLYKLCVISTSPFMHQGIPIINESIDRLFKQVIDDQRHFIRKYIFFAYPKISWAGQFTREISDPVRAWRLVLSTQIDRFQSMPEMPNALLIDLIDDSLSLFTNIYGEFQPERGRAIDMRMDIFTIVDTVSHSFPTEMPSSTLMKIWYLLLIAAIVGARKTDFDTFKYQVSPQPDMPYLGLDKTSTEFIDYPLALGRLGKKFENEKEKFPMMVEYLRANIDGQTGNTFISPSSSVEMA